MKRKKNTAGFTLIELVVVLAILAILATLILAALSGYIKKAGKNSLMSDCRSCVICAKSLLSSDYAETGEFHIPSSDEITEMAGLNGSVSDITLKNNDILTLTYTTPDNRAVKYNAEPSVHYEFVDDETEEPPAVLTKEEAITKTTEALKEISGLKASTNTYSTIPNDKYGNYEKLIAILPEEVMDALSDTVYTVCADQYGSATKLIVFNGTAAEFISASGTLSVTVYDIKTGQTSQKRGAKGTSESKTVLTEYVW